MIYLDNAATGFPKPPSVVEEVYTCLTEYGGNPGRGAHRLSMRAAERVYACREAAASLLGVSDPARILFVQNATMALNTAIKGLAEKGDHVLISDMEHNAVLRPLKELERRGIITLDVFPTAGLATSPAALMRAVEERIRPNTRLLVALHASNICSLQLPMYELGTLCRRKGIRFVVDASQSAGHISIDMERMQIDALCLPGHKGLMGVQGSGILALAEGVLPHTLVEGGSGYRSLDPFMPSELPERYEAGTPSTPAIAGLLRGIEEVKRIGVERIARHERMLFCHLRRKLSSMKGVTLYLPEQEGSILLFNLDGIPSEEVGRALDLRGICVRAGFHCAALAHATLGTGEQGAVRVSTGIYNDFSDLDALVDAVEDILSTSKQ